MSFTCDLSRFRRYVEKRSEGLPVAPRLRQADWPRYAVAAGQELAAYFAALELRGWVALIVRWDHEGNGHSVILDADDQPHAFADGPRDPQAVVDWAGFLREALAVEPAELQQQDGGVFSAVIECLSFLCAELLVQNADVLAATAAENWGIAVQSGHNETPRIVYRRLEPAASVFDDTGYLAAATVEEAIERAGDDGKAVAALFSRVRSAGDYMKLLGKTSTVFLRVAKSGDLAAGREELMALLAAMATNARRLNLRVWPDVLEKALSNALVCPLAHNLAFELAQKLLPENLTVSPVAYNMACMHALFGKRDAALRWTQKALSMGHDPAKFAASDFDSLRDNAAFKRLVAGPGLATEALTRKLGKALSTLDLEDAKKLIAAGADVTGTYDGYPMLCVALNAWAHTDEEQARRAEAVAFLLDAGVTLEDDEWPWHRIHRDKPLLRLLLDRGIPVTNKLLREAVENENLKTLKYLVGRGVVFKERGHFFWHACRHHKAADTLQYLLDQGIDLTPLDGEQPFALALGSADNVTLLELLVAKGIDVHGRDESGCTLISHAICNDNEAVVRWAVAHGAALDATNNEGAGLVLQAIDDGATACLTVLLEGGAPVNLRDHSGRTALHAAAARNDLDAVEKLLAKGADPKAEDNDGKTPLELATGVKLKSLLSVASPN